MLLELFNFCHFFSEAHLCQGKYLTWIDKVSLRIQQDAQRLHVVVKIFKDCCAFTQDAVSRKNCPLLVQQQRHVVISVARCEEHPEDR